MLSKMFSERAQTPDRITMIAVLLGMKEMGTTSDRRFPRYDIFYELQIVRH